MGDKAVDVGADKSGGKNIVAVPDEKVVTEDVKTSGMGAKGSAAAKDYKSLGANDELTKTARGSGSLYTIHFDYDKFNIRENDKPLLAKNAKWLDINPAVHVRIEGYADERGESEYNLALGDKRAHSVERYLEDMGIRKERLATISYGEEKPVDPGHDEDAWAKNRRAEFKIAN
ncbi:MAG: peptidoglycan-associated lipoprotein Pal [Deltaproteobacteria bacterium]|nr:peptidoglycan-associated lipoprotein Pal [Deltaproteobacteria bacterium]